MALSHIHARLRKVAFELVWENNSRSLRPKAKSTNYMPTRQLEPRKDFNFLSDYVKLKSSRFLKTLDEIIFEFVVLLA